MKTRKERFWESQERHKAPDSAIKVSAWLTGTLLFTLVALLGLFFRVRIGLLHHRAIGRLFCNTEYFLRRRKMFPPEKREWVVLISGTPINHPFLTMVKRQCRVFESDTLWSVLDELRKRTPDHPVWINLGLTGWLRGAEWIEPGPQLSFTAEEHERGQALLRHLGIPEGARHVCIFARDERFFDNPDTAFDPDDFWCKHDYRKSSIENLLPAAEFLAGQGLWVVRVASHGPKPLLPGDRHPNIIDYAGVIRESLEDPEFADLYLQAACKFYLGDPAATYTLSSVFDVPIAYTNMVPFGECGRKPSDIFICKKCRNGNSGTFIPYPRLIERGLDTDWITTEELQDLMDEGIEFIENSPEEILQLAIEMNRRLDGEWTPHSDDEALQARFRTIWPARCFDGSDFPGPVGADFLRRNRDLLISDGENPRNQDS